MTARTVFFIIVISSLKLPGPARSEKNGPDPEDLLNKPHAARQISAQIRENPIRQTLIGKTLVMPSAALSAGIHAETRDIQGIHFLLPGTLMEQPDPTPCSDLFGRSFATE